MDNLFIFQQFTRNPAEAGTHPSTSRRSTPAVPSSQSGFARVDQRLETIEHAVIPAAEAPR